MAINFKELRDDPEAYIMSHWNEQEKKCDFTKEELAVLLTKGNGIVTEDEVFLVGAEIKTEAEKNAEGYAEKLNEGAEKNAKRYAGARLGAGTNAAVISMLITNVPEYAPELKRLNDKNKEYEILQHLVGKVRRILTVYETPEMDTTTNQNFKEKVLLPIKATIDAYLEKLTPIHNTEALRGLASTMFNDRSKVLSFEKEALKVIPKPADPKKQSNLLKEYGLMGKLKQVANIPRVDEWLEADKWVGFSLKAVDGRNLESILHENEKSWRKHGERFLTPEVALAIMHQIYVAHGQMARENVFYQDDQLGNIMVDFKNGTVYIIDLGKAEEVLPGKKTIDEIGGDVRYYSPEVMKNLKRLGPGKYIGAAPYHHKTPFWALGVVDFLLKTNEFPFHGDGSTQQQFEILKRNIISGKYHNPRSLNPAWTKREVELTTGRTLLIEPDERGNQEDKAIKEKDAKYIIPSYDYMADITRDLLKARVGNKPVIDVIHDGLTSHMQQERADFYKGLKKGSSPIKKPARVDLDE